MWTCVKHFDLELGQGIFLANDGVLLNAVGMDLWALGIQEGVE